jgi:hypothetical protein
MGHAKVISHFSSSIHDTSLRVSPLIFTPVWGCTSTNNGYSDVMSPIGQLMGDVGERFILSERDEEERDKSDEEIS